jgi:hypothetical protein
VLSFPLGNSPTLLVCNPAQTATQQHVTLDVHNDQELYMTVARPLAMAIGLVSRAGGVREGHVTTSNVVLKKQRQPCHRGESSAADVIDAPGRQADQRKESERR